MFFWLRNFLQNNIKTYVYLEEMMTEKLQKLQKVANEYYCEICDYRCSNLFNFNKHCSTRKHKMMTNDDPKNNNVEPIHVCSHCNKIYKTKQSLWVHKQKCKAPEKENISMVPQDDDVANLPIQNYIMKLVEQNKLLVDQNQDFKQTMLELAKNQNTTINNNTNNIQNKITNNNTQFNLNVFLQQTCKDAINMSDFIDSLEINTKSLERTGTHGYVDGISKIFMDGLRKLKIQERPIHCTDLKREVLYIKDNDKWTKDTEDNKQFKKALATVVHRNMIQIVQWEEENPETSDPESKNYDFYFEVVRQSLGGGNDEVTARNNEKILKVIAQEVHIDKKVKELL